MAPIFDNMDNHLLTTLRATMQASQRADFPLVAATTRFAALDAWRDTERGLIQ